MINILFECWICKIELVFSQSVFTRSGAMQLERMFFTPYKRDENIKMLFPDDGL